MTRYRFLITMESAERIPPNTLGTAIGNALRVRFPQWYQGIEYMPEESENDS